MEDLWKQFQAVSESIINLNQLFLMASHTSKPKQKLSGKEPAQL